jgi:cellulose synthase/poly-beta-1,6-N-acetylglucosamine synthase-like glycosyltransferase
VIYYLTNSYLSRKNDKTKRSMSPLYEEDDVTVVITVYRESPEYLRKAIRQVKGQAREVIVVGDGIEEPYRSVAMEENVKFECSKERSGKRFSMSLGASLVKTSVVVFMDGDMIPDKDAIPLIMKEYVEGVGGVGGNINFDTTDGKFSSFASQFIERSKEIIQRSMKHFGSVMLIDGGFGTFRMDVVGDYIQSKEFYDFRIEGKIPYYGGGDDADLTAYIIRNGFVATKCFDAKTTTIPKPDMKSYFKQSVRWSRTGWRSFRKSRKDGTIKRANKFYVFEQYLTYILPVFFLFVLIFRGITFADVTYHRGFIQGLLSMIGLQGTIHVIHTNFYSIAFRLSSTSSAVASLVFAGSVARRTIKDRLKTIAYGSIGAAMLFVATIYAMFTANKA